MPGTKRIQLLSLLGHFVVDAVEAELSTFLFENSGCGIAFAFEFAKKTKHAKKSDAKKFLHFNAFCIVKVVSAPKRAHVVIRETF